MVAGLGGAVTEVKTPPVPATRVDDIDAVKATPGAFEYYVSDYTGRETPAGIIYRCLCGCGLTGALAFRPGPRPSWHWDGNRDKPTLSPSVHHVGHWHGYLRAGVWVSC
jgi:hypothetical protein